MTYLADRLKIVRSAHRLPRQQGLGSCGIDPARGAPVVPFIRLGICYQRGATGVTPTLISWAIGYGSVDQPRALARLEEVSRPGG